MGYIPEDAKWYLADMIFELRIEGRKRSLVHINRILIRADSPDEAFEESNRLGKARSYSYMNPDGAKVRCKFRGLRELLVIHEDLEHGAEIAYTELQSVTEAKIKKLTSKKRDLGVFAPRVVTTSADYMPREIAEHLKKLGFRI